MNSVLVIVLAFLAGGCLLWSVADLLNLRHMKPALPREFEGFYDAAKYATAAGYLREKTIFGIARRCALVVFAIAFILAGGFGTADRAARALGAGAVPTGLIFAGILLLAAQVVLVPFSAWNVFVIERKYGFNRMTVRTYVMDLLKSLALTAVLGGIVFSAVILLFERAGPLAWLYCWVAVSLFQLFVLFVAPVVIMPLFNRFVPMEDGELKRSIEKFAGEHDFKMKGVFTMDASRRSTKSNAMFTGFGRFRRIVLFDTLIRKHDPAELVCVLAHEVGHYKMRHVPKLIGLSFLTGGLMFYAVSLLIGYEPLFKAFRIAQPSVYAGLVIIVFLFMPVDAFLSMFGNWLSRKFEFEADAFAVGATGKPETMILALKKLSIDHLANLTPHPLKVFLDYSHPPVLHRIKAIEEISGSC